MKITKIRLLLALGVSATLFAQVEARAQNSTTAPAGSLPTKSQAEPTTPKASSGPFHGKLAAVDLASRTIKVGKRTFFVTAETKIHKSGKTAKLEDGVVGEPCSGYVKADEHGRLIAKSITFGAKPVNEEVNQNAKAKNSKQPKTAAPE